MFFNLFNTKIKQKQKETAERLVDAYICLCREADVKLESFSKKELDNGYAQMQLIPYRFNIDICFKRMKVAVDICPKKFRNEMAFRLKINGLVM